MVYTAISRPTFALRLVGYGNWNADKITVMVTDTSRYQSPAIRAALVKHISNLIRSVFLSQRPTTPAQSRWTGVPAVARFAYGLYAFHRLFSFLCKKLAPRGKGGEHQAGNADGPGDAGDADVPVPVTLNFKCLNHKSFAF